METKDYFECQQCGHCHEIVVIPTQCPVCGGTVRAQPQKTAAEQATAASNARFKLAADRAKGNF